MAWLKQCFAFLAAQFPLRYALECLGIKNTTEAPKTIPKPRAGKQHLESISFTSSI